MLRERLHKPNWFSASRARTPSRMAAFDDIRQAFALLTVLPGEPFRQVTPMPAARAWWLYPFYLALGLPRDLIDTVAGGFNYIPIINLPVVLGGAALLPLGLVAGVGLRVSADGRGAFQLETAWR